MIIKAFIKLQPFTPIHDYTCLLHKYLQLFCNSKQISTQLRADLIQKLNRMNIKTKKSIIVQQPQQQNIDQSSNQQKKIKINKFSFRKLTIPEKIQLGILIPHAPFNMRMTKKSEQQYRQTICQNLYQAQKQNLNTSIRILQLQIKKTNIDQYINSIYKDIFSRYMVSKGYGVQWQASNSHYGIMNPVQKTKQSKQTEIKQFYGWICELMGQYPLAKKQVIALYSYSNHKHIKIDDVSVQNMYKIGYYFKLHLTSFGRFKDSFDRLRESNAKIQLLVMVEDPIKLLNIQAICIQPNKKMIILSKYQQQQTQQEAVEQKINCFLVTSMDCYSQNQQYFNSHGYSKHQIFDSFHLLQMEVQNGIKIYNDIQAYSRKGGAYIIDRFSGLPDFQRASQLELNPLNSKKYFDQQGKLIKLSEKLNEPIYITDPHYSQKILKNLQVYGVKAEKIELFSTYQDQVYSYNNEKLHFKISNKYVIPIPQSHHQQLQQALQKSIVSQSKVLVPRKKPQYSKPRDKRRHIKQIRKLKEQQTQYLSLRQCLDSYDSLSFSTNIKGYFTFPVIICETETNGVLQQQIYMNQRIRKLIVQSLLIKNQQIIEWDIHRLQQFLNSLTSQIDKQGLNNRKLKLKLINLSQNLFGGFLCFKNYSLRPQLSNIVIEPQSKTQDVVPYFFHLHYLIHKMSSKINPKVRGRKTKKTDIINKLFSLIKFHPTIDQSQRQKSVDQILFGVLKANNQQQYGYGLEAVRLWVARHDSYLGDRILNDKQINKQLPLSSFIRKMYWQILPLMKIDLNKIVIENSENQIQLTPGENSIVPRQKLSYFHNFIVDHINYYIMNMEECYNKLNLSKAVELTEDFFKNYLNQIFVKTVRKRMIAYPFAQQNQQHIYVLRKIIDLLAVVAPILPYSAYHISKTQLLKWPEVNEQDVRTQLIPNYNRMTKFRVEVRNKFLINKFPHSQLVIPVQKGQNEAKIWNLTQQDLQLFFDIENISFSQPKQQGKSFQLRVKENHPMGNIERIKFYEYKDVCIRCSPNHNYGTHLCEKCLSYLNSNFGRKLPLIS